MEQTKAIYTIYLDLMGPLVMSLWIQAGLKFVQRQALAPATTTMYIDDRTITGNSASVLASHQASWASWSDQTGLLENAAKTEATGTSARLQQDLGTCFPPREIKKYVKLLGACTYCNPRSHTEAEER